MKDLKSKKSKIITKKSNVDVNDANLVINLILNIVKRVVADFKRNRLSEVVPDDQMSLSDCFGSPRATRAGGPVYYL
jgi:hypothetical protein